MPWLNAPAIASCQCAEDNLDFLFEIRQFGLGQLPDGREVHVKVVMNKHIAQTGDAAPGDFRVLLPEFGGQKLRRFPDDFQLADYGVLPVGLGHEDVASSGTICFDLVNGVEDMPEVNSVALHRTSDSLNTCGRI